MRAALFQNFKRNMLEAAIGKCPLEINALPTQFWKFDSKLMEGTKNVGKFLEHIIKELRFNKAAALQPIYLLKRAFLLKKILMVMLKI